MKGRRIAKAALMGVAYAIAFMVAAEFVLWALRLVLLCMITISERGAAGA